MGINKRMGNNNFDKCCVMAGLLMEDLLGKDRWYKEQGTRYKAQGARHKVQGTRYKAQGTGKAQYPVNKSRLKTSDSELRTQNSVLGLCTKEPEVGQYGSGIDIIQEAAFDNTS